MCQVFGFYCIVCLSGYLESLGDAGSFFLDSDLYSEYTQKSDGF